MTLAKQAKFMMRKPAPLSSPCDFVLKKQPSLIADAGDGLFIQVNMSMVLVWSCRPDVSRVVNKGSAKKGTVLGFYPGCVYSESDQLLVYPHIFTDNYYLAFRSDKAPHDPLVFGPHLCTLTRINDRNWLTPTAMVDLVRRFLHHGRESIRGKPRPRVLHSFRFHRTP